jgi:NAD(P)-dependent dehydrogenase (short-subunit alcohol dehydrogenase family)
MPNNVTDRMQALVIGASRGIGLALVQCLLDDPRYGRIWAACRALDQSTELNALVTTHAQRLQTLALDVSDESSLISGAERLFTTGPRLHLLINTAGVLHDATGLSPERRLEDVQAANLLRSFQVNALGPLLVAKHFARLLTHDERAVLANLSARVGSISDNRLGGWYAYRGAKAAQNQFNRTLSIEMARRAPNLVVLTLHPGTVDTALSKPFQAGVPPAKLFSAPQAAGQLLNVIHGATPNSSGRFFAWDGTEIPW